MDFDAKEVCLKPPTFRAPGSRSSQTCGKSPLCHIQATWSADRGIRGRGQLLREGGWRREVWARTQRNRSQECYQYEAWRFGAEILGLGVSGSKVWQLREVCVCVGELSVSHADCFHLLGDVGKSTVVDIWWIWGIALKTPTVQDTKWMFLSL